MFCCAKTYFFKNKKVWHHEPSDSCYPKNNQHLKRFGSTIIMLCQKQGNKVLKQTMLTAVFEILCKCCSFLGQGHISRPLGPLQVPFPVAHRPTPKSFKPTLSVDKPTPGLSSFFNRSRWSGSSTMQRRKAKADASWVVIFGASQASNDATLAQKRAKNRTCERRGV